MYECESDLALNPFAFDVEFLLITLAEADVRIGILSDIHIDVRPGFSAHRFTDGRTWADAVTAWALSYEMGFAKPDPRAFTTALDHLGLPAERVLMVGDRGPWDGAAAEVGITTLILPPLTSVDDLRLHRVIDLVLPSRGPRFPSS